MRTSPSFSCTSYILFGSQSIVNRAKSSENECLHSLEDFCVFRSFLAFFERFFLVDIDKIHKSFFTQPFYSIGVIHLKTAVREQRIISILESRGEMSVNELGAILNISVSTLRKQLADMQEKKLIIRTYGGVMSINPVPDETFDSKLHKNVNEKRRIATKARSLIKSGDSLSLGSGTTVYALSNLLDDLDSAEIYTNSMQAAEYLANWAILNTHICGGIIRSATGTIIGSEAYNFFNNIDVDYAFISCDAVDDNGIVYSDNLAVATVERAVLRNARKKYVLCDSTKFGKSSVASIADLADCEAVITGTEAKSVTENLKFRGVNIIFA